MMKDVNGAEKAECPGEWYRSHHCDHAHCPASCDKPGPIWHESRLLCGRCAVLYGEVRDMIPCTPETCDD